MYSIPSVIGGSAITLSDQSMAPFVLTRKKRQTSAAVARENFTTEHLIGLNAVEAGFTGDVKPVEHILQPMAICYGQILAEGIDGESFHDLYLASHPLEKQIPGIIFRLGYDTIDPLREETLFNLLCDALQIPKRTTENETECLWMVIVKLCFLDIRTFFCARPLSEQLIIASAINIQGLCQNLINQN
jgi:hypothetical protein